jgi:hypothetical protein
MVREGESFTKSKDPYPREALKSETEVPLVKLSVLSG